MPGNAVVAPASTFGAWLTLGWPNTLPNGWQAVWCYAWITLATALALVWLTARRTEHWALANPSMRRVGRVSYAGYLWNFPLAHAMSPLVFVVHDLTDWGLYACIAVWFPMFALAVYGLAESSYWMVERPYLRAHQLLRPENQRGDRR